MSFLRRIVQAFSTKRSEGPAQKKMSPSVLPPVDHPERMLEGARILFADDNLDQHFLFQESFRPLGVHLTCVRNGIEAIEAVKREEFHAILMDIAMPVLDGSAATRQLRELGYAGPIIAMTGYFFPDEWEKSRDDGFTDHLSKPFSSEALFQTLARHIRR